MKQPSVIVLVAALALGMGSASFAQGRPMHSGPGGDHPSRAHRPVQSHPGPGMHRHVGPPPRMDFGPPGRANDRGPRFAPGYGPRADFRRGARLPLEYRARYYVVDDWRNHRLNRPPRGHHWVQVGPDYVLVAIATGIIVQVLLGY